MIEHKVRAIWIAVLYMILSLSNLGSIGGGLKHISSTTTAKSDEGSASTVTTSSLSTSTTTLPLWMTEYFVWHQQHRELFIRNRNTTQQKQRYRFLILTCQESDRCGGTADRLRPIPLFLWLAAKSKRILLIHWTRPFPLEEFLLPTDRFNWTVPESLLPYLNETNDNNNNENKRNYYDRRFTNNLHKAVHNSNLFIVQGNDYTGGERQYREFWEQEKRKEEHEQQSVTNYSSISKASTNNDDNGSYAPFFHEMFWDFVFQPSPPIQRLVHHYQTKMGLVPNQYVVTHIRAKYPNEPYRVTGSRSALQETVDNALDCTISLLLPNTNNTNSTKNGVIYVASDTAEALELAHEYHDRGQQQRRQQLPQIVTILNNTIVMNYSSQKDSPHLNFYKASDPSEYYSIFVDMVFMGYSRCVSFGVGGFGFFGSLMSFNASCSMRYSIKGVQAPQTCHAG